MCYDIMTYAAQSLITQFKLANLSIVSLDKRGTVDVTACVHLTAHSVDTHIMWSNISHVTPTVDIYNFLLCVCGVCVAYR